MYTDHIVADREVMGGVPRVHGTRIPAATIVGLIAEGQSADDIVAAYPQLSVDDVHAALEYAASVLDDRQLPLRTSA